MINCTKPDDFRRELPRLLNGRKHIVFLTDCDEGRMFIGTLALGIFVSGQIAGDFVSGELDVVFQGSTGRRHTVVFFAVPKDMLPAADVRRAMEASRLRVTMPGPDEGERDLVALGDPDFITRFVQSVIDGEFVCCNPNLN